MQNVGALIDKGDIAAEKVYVELQKALGKGIEAN